MKKNTWILLIAIALLALATYWFKSKPKSTAAKPSDYFAVKDTAAVTKIFMATKSGSRITLERGMQNVWIVNGKVPADFTKINLLLTTLHDLQIKMPVPETMHNTAMGILGTAGIKVEVYSGNERVKTLYVGTETPDKEGTFMILENEDQPYIIQQPGFIGFLTPRFNTTEIRWRSKEVFNLQANEIKKISFTYPAEPNAGFLLDADLFAQQQNVYAQGGKPFAADTLACKLLLKSFGGIYAEGFYEDSVFTIAEKDSLFKLQPYCVIEVLTRKNQTHKTTLYAKPLSDKTKDRYDEQGNERTIDPDKFYARLGDTYIVASVQEYVFRRILRKREQMIR